MRYAALIMLLGLAIPGCKTKKVETRQTVEEAPRMSSTIRMGDASAAAQLVSGFHQIEDNNWRWTQREFTVSLGVPPGAAQKGAVLSLRLSVPPPVIEKLKTVTLTASINGTDLEPETYSRTGSDTYKRNVPPALLTTDTVQVNFRLDKAMPPGGGDLRELGLVTLSAGLETK